MDLAEPERVIRQQHSTFAQMIGRPRQVRRVRNLVRVDEDEIERRLSLDLRQPVQRGPDVDVRARRDARLVERLVRHPRVLFRIFEGMQDAVRPHAAQQADAAVAAERADLDRLGSAGRARQHLEVQAVEPADRNRRQALADAAFADLAQHGVFGVIDAVRPPLERGVALTEAFFDWR